MRILYHHRTLADGAEGIHIAAMVDAFRRLGHDVQVMGVAPDAPLERRRFVEGIRARLPRPAFELASIALNVPEHLHVRRAIAAYGPDLLYARHGRFNVGALQAARRARVPSVLEVNALFTAPGYEAFERLALLRLARRLERSALQQATLVTTVSSPLADQVRQLAGVQPMIVPNGADPERFNAATADGGRIRESLGLNGRLVVGWTGIVREWHGLDLLVDAVSAVPGATLLVVGDGPARSALEAHTRQRGTPERLVVTGRVPHAQVPDYLAAMDIAVVSDDRTGIASPMKLLEYMATGCAVLAPRTASIRDVIADGVDGVLFDPGDARDLAERLQRLAADAGLRQRLGAQARTKIERERNWTAIARQVLAGVATGETGEAVR